MVGFTQGVKSRLLNRIILTRQTDQNALFICLLCLVFVCPSAIHFATIMFVYVISSPCLGLFPE